MTQAQIAALRPCLLVYDIPENVPIPNPSAYLYSRAVRIGYSTWVIPEETPVDYYFGQLEAGFQRWLRTERGIRWRNSAQGIRWISIRGERGFCFTKAELRPETAYVLLPMMEASIKATVAEKIAAAQATYANSEEQLSAEFEAGIVTVRERNTRLRVYRRQMNLVVKRCTKLLESLQGIAGQFGISLGNTTADAYRVVQAIQGAMNQRATAYYEATEELAARLGGDNALVRAARADSVPNYALADAMQEEGIPSAGFRASFTPEQSAYLDSLPAE